MQAIIASNYGHFTYGTLRLLDSSPTVWSFRLLDTSPTGQWSFRLQDISPTGHFAYCLAISPTVLNLIHHAVFENHMLGLL